ncbi:MAG: CHC2 zinc finger domain-containing protein [Chloroflexota bacterium]|nr:CHC2 zinc finger domain-containing protein [Chloroflexota bacterium]
MGTVDDIKDRVDIVEVVGKCLKLERAGRNYRALCPFHDEKTPSFVVFPDSQRWQCFGACDEGGDVFDFVMRREGWDFRTAMVELARKAGVELPRWSEKARVAMEERRGREAVFGVAARFWAEALAGSAGEGYTRGRGWTEETIGAAGLGFWGGDREGMRQALKEAGVDVGSGPARAVLGMPAGSLVYPHVRGGKVVYFAARGVEGKRHWNPPRELVGERRPYFNHRWRRDGAVVVVEGQGDGVTLAQWGIGAVALAGAGAGEGLLKVLRQGKMVYVGLDEDATGAEAGRKLASALGPLVRVVRWPAHDVNDWLLENGDWGLENGEWRIENGERGRVDAELVNEEMGTRCRELLGGAPTWLEVLIGEARAAEAEEMDAAVRAVFSAMVGLDPFSMAKYRALVAEELSLSLGTVDGLLRAARQASGLDDYGRPLYQVLGGKICKRTYDRMGGESVVPLCNFDARIIEDVVEDDGEDQERRFAIEGKLSTGETLARVEVEASEFAQMGWVLPRWGARAAVAAGGSMRDHLRTAIQTLSKEIETRYEYSHLGWRRLDNKQVYLSAAGAMGREGVQVQIIRDLAGYRLPTWPDGARKAMGLSLGFLETGNYQVTMPLWAAMFLAPLASIIPPSFTIWVFGTTGSLKSTATALAMCHYGRFAYNTPPASWTGTANALEKKAFLVKDAPLWIDDFTTQTTMAGMKEIKKKADQLLRDWGNRSGRSRMRADLKLRRTFVPRGLIISTAEQLPPGQSILSRLFAVEVHPQMMTRGEGSALTRAQVEDSLLYPQAMGGYVLWLAERWEELEERLPERLMEYTERARGEGQHLRMPGNVATMYLGMELGLEYAEVTGAIDGDTRVAMGETGWGVLLGIGEQQHQVVAEEKPVEMYISALEQMFAQGTVFLRHRERPKQRAGTAELLGWYDEQYWYLLPKAAYNAVWQFYRCSGVVFPDSERGVRVKLLEQGVLRPQGGDGRHTYRLRVEEGMPRVLRLVRPVAEGVGSSGTAGTTGTTGTTGTVDVDEIEF